MTVLSADWHARPGLADLVSALGGDGEAVRFIGGFVRDSLLGLHPSDVDLATVHAPDETARRIREAGFKAVLTGAAHGTVTAVLPSGPVEVTTLRRDVETNGRHAVVAFTDDWRADAARRDFTINALSADPAGGAIHDYFDGLADLDAGRVRFIGAPLERIAEDHLRILRFFRFQARFGRGAPSAPDLAACALRANDLMALSRERIAQELTKLLALPDPGATARIMANHGIFAPILPEIEGDGVDRLVALIAREGDAGDPIRRLAALLPPEPAIAERIAARLKLSNAHRKRLACAVGAPEGEARALAYAVGSVCARDRLLIAGDMAGLVALADWEPPRLPISGGALVQRGLQQGPMVAATLAAIERRWVAEGFPADDRLSAIVDAEVLRALADGR